MLKTTAPSNVHVQRRLHAPDLALERLREAVRQAGGQTAVAARSGIKMRSLSNYLGGLNDMKRQTIVALADACGVTVEWLAAGRGPMRPSDPPPSSQPQQNGPTEPTKLFATIDMDRFASALEGAHDAFARKGTRPSWRRLAQVASLIYDAIGDDGQSDDPTEVKEK